MCPHNSILYPFYRGVKYCHWIRWFYQTGANRRQPGRVDGPKASQHSIITYKIHFCINQDKTHQDGRFSFGLSSDATKKYCIGKSCKLKHYRLLLGVFWQAKYAYIPWHYMVMWRLCKRRSIVLLSKLDKIDLLLLSDFYKWRLGLSLTCDVKHDLEINHADFCELRATIFQVI